MGARADSPPPHGSLRRCLLLRDCNYKCGYGCGNQVGEMLTRPCDARGHTGRQAGIGVVQVEFHGSPTPVGTGGTRQPVLEYYEGVDFTPAYYSFGWNGSRATRDQQALTEPHSARPSTARHMRSSDTASTDRIRRPADHFPQGRHRPGRTDVPAVQGHHTFPDIINSS